MGGNDLGTAVSACSFLGPVLFPLDEDYDSSRRIWNGAFDRRPAVVIRAVNTDEVCKAVGLAASLRMVLAVRGGGHSIPGFSSCDGGIMLDLSLINSVSVDPVTRVATVGGGALLGQLDAAGAEHGLVVPAGVISHTGVAGLTLGGGMGYLSRRFGMTVDSLIGAEVVTADGAIVNCSATEEPELFWGIRGGGGNFGVVTAFRFKMHELGPVQMGKWHYPQSSVAEVLTNYRQMAGQLDREVSTSLNISQSGLNLTAFSSGASANNAESILPLGRLGVGVSGGIMKLTYCAFQSRNDSAVPWGRRYYSRGGFLRDLHDDAITAMIDAATIAPTDDSEIYVLQLGGAVCDVSDDATAYSGRSAAFYWVANPAWDEAADDTRCLDWGRTSARRLMTLSMDTNYVNEQGETDGSVAEAAYGHVKFGRLSALKKQFDPENLFRLNQNIAPKATGV